MLVQDVLTSQVPLTGTEQPEDHAINPDYNLLQKYWNGADASRNVGSVSNDEDGTRELRFLKGSL